MLLCLHRLKPSPPEIARRVVRIQILTLVWMTVEAVVPLGAAWIASIVEEQEDAGVSQSPPFRPRECQHGPLLEAGAL
jgi:hypothetical protein